MSTLGTERDEVVFGGTMMEEPLLLKSIVERIELMFGDQELVVYDDDGASTRVSYAALAERVRRVASSLERLGVRRGDRVATFLWNSQEHLELYLAVPAMGAVLHPLNIRLHPGELAQIIEHAGDSVVVVDQTIADRLPELSPQIKKVYVRRSAPGHEGVDYESLVSSGDPGYVFPRIPENSASAMCYTSGTTGMPKGVVYTHRSTVLHTILQNLPDYYGIRESDVVLPIVPMFHANAWGLPYATLMVGGRLVLSGSNTSPERIVAMIAEQQATFSAGVPTIWHGVGELKLLPDLSSLRMVVAGGSALSAAFLQRFDELGIPVIQGWGMTETNPLVAVGRVPARSAGGSEAEMVRARQAQGRPLPFVEMRRDADVGGELQLRGPTISAGYYNSPEETAERLTADGWLRTGDVAEIEPGGVVRIVDRTKDMVKSGGEWIPSVELENLIASHPAVAEAAVVPVPDTRWGERPAAFVVVREGNSFDPEDLRAFLAPRVARWWIPELVRVVPEMPKTSVGKFDKKLMRQQVAGGLSAGEAGSR